jgi:1,4-alpha-glucan branching enzyme
MNATIRKRKHTFTFNAPAAKSVQVVGDFTRWLRYPIALRKQPSGTWKATTALAPGTYHYRFLVDGEWCDDPKCRVRVQNPFGTVNDVVQITGSTTNDPSRVLKQESLTVSITPSNQVVKRSPSDFVI